jgi:hydrogenase maturation protein HypF
VGGLASIDYVGGDLSAIYAARSVVAILRNRLGSSIERADLLKLVDTAPIAPDTTMSSDTLAILTDSFKHRINLMSSTSTGRFLDAAALVLGVCSMNSYDGECPMKLEAVAKPSDLRIDPQFKKSDDGDVIDTTHGLMQVLEMKRRGFNRSEIAYAVQWYVGESLAHLACKTAKENQIQHVGFSGGVALNRVITKAIVDYVSQEGLTPLVHNNVPPGDGGVSIGQVVVGAAKLNNY